MFTSLGFERVFFFFPSFFTKTEIFEFSILNPSDTESGVFSKNKIK
jgi:hypothetical protein